jgi:hypothetical protein
MKIKAPDLIEVYRSLLKSQVDFTPSVAVLGPPGVGKTESVQRFISQLAQEEGLLVVRADEVLTYQDYEQKCPEGNCVFYIYLNVNTALPPDISGIPEKIAVNGKPSAVWLPMQYWLFCRQAKYCIVTIDEFNASQNPDMLATVMRLLSECEAGAVNICRENGKERKALILAFGNPSEMSSVAGELPAPLLGGKTLLLQAEPPNLRDWIRYMTEKYGNKWDKRIASFLASVPDMFTQYPRSDTADQPYPTPRGWTKASVMCYQNPQLCPLFVEGYCGSEARSAFEEFLKNADISVDDVLNATGEQRLTKLIIYAGLGKLCDDVQNNKDKVDKLVEVLSEEESAVLTYLASPMCPERLVGVWKKLKEAGKLEGVLEERLKMTTPQGIAKAFKQKLGL